MNQRYESRKEYSLMDVLKYNLRNGGLRLSLRQFCSDRRWIQGKNPDAIY